jgi:hypothetical protein
VRVQEFEPADMGREAVLAWLSAAGACQGFSDALGKARPCTDVFAMGVLAVALRLCRPILKSPDKFLARLDTNYYESSLYIRFCLALLF